MSLLLFDRAPSDELLDGGLSAEESEESLADIEWVHSRLGGRRLLRRGLLPLLESLPGAPREPLTLLDLGSGSGHVGRDLTAAFAGRGRALRVTGLDRQLAHARLSERRRSIAADSLRLPFSDGCFDVVFSTLFLHHFSPDELGVLFGESRRVARRAVVFFDLTRSRLGLIVITLVGPLAFKSRVSVLDGRASVRQAYTPDEMRTIARAPLPGARVEPAGPFVWRLLWTPP